MADRKLFIGNLVRRITQEDLWVMYSTFGPLEECAKFHESFGFVRFLHADDARAALDATHGIILKGRCIKVEFAATTTSWKSANSSCCHQCRPTVRYNIPPIRANDAASTRSHHHVSTHPTSSTISPPIAPIGHRRKVTGQSSICGSNSSIGKSHKSIRSQLSSSSSPPSSYTASSSHITEIDDYDCDLDSGYNDEFDNPLLSSTINTGSTSAWHDLPMTDEMFIWDFQLYASIARELPLIKTNNCDLISHSNDTSSAVAWLRTINADDYF